MKYLSIVLLGLALFLSSCEKDDGNDPVPGPDPNNNNNNQNTEAPTDYCTPPKFKTGPWTGIINVNLGDIVNASYNNVGYMLYDDASITTTLKRGTKQKIYVALSGIEYYALNVRVWIDWNRDGDFEDEGEEAAAWDATQEEVAITDIEVPADASLGKTRVRIYNDMTESMGHLPPSPCGYLSNPNHSLGQHGECEDYIVTIAD